MILDTTDVDKPILAIYNGVSGDGRKLGAAFSYDGIHVIAGSMENDIKIYDATTGMWIVFSVDARMFYG